MKGKCQIAGCEKEPSGGFIKHFLMALSNGLMFAAGMKRKLELRIIGGGNLNMPKKRHPHKRSIPPEQRKELRTQGEAWWIKKQVKR